MAWLYQRRGHQRIEPISDVFFAAVGDYLRHERPATDYGRLFVALKGPSRGQPLIDAARQNSPGALGGFQRSSLHPEGWG